MLGFSSLMGAVNYITTIVNMRAPGMTWFRLPLPIWALFITAILVLLAIPVLTGALIMLLFDQTIGTSFFLPQGRRSAAAVAAPVLVLRAPRGLHPDPAGDGDRIGGASPTARASRSSATTFDGLRDRCDRVPGLGRLGPPHVPERHEPAAGRHLHDLDDDHRGALGDQGVQLAGHALAAATSTSTSRCCTRSRSWRCS